MSKRETRIVTNSNIPCKGELYQKDLYNRKARERYVNSLFLNCLFNLVHYDPAMHRLIFVLCQNNILLVLFVNICNFAHILRSS